MLGRVSIYSYQHGKRSIEHRIICAINNTYWSAFLFGKGMCILERFSRMFKPKLY